VRGPAGRGDEAGPVADGLAVLLLDGREVEGGALDGFVMVVSCSGSRGGVVVGEEAGEGGRDGLGAEFLGVPEAAGLDEPAGEATRPAQRRAPGTDDSPRAGVRPGPFLPQWSSRSPRRNRRGHRRQTALPPKAMVRHRCPGKQQALEPTIGVREQIGWWVSPR